MNRNRLDDERLHELELQLQLALKELLEYTGLSGFVVQWAGSDVPQTYYAVVGTLREIHELVQVVGLPAGARRRRAGIH